MKLIIILIQFLLYQSRAQITNQVISQLTQDLIANENVPTLLSAFTCWPKSDNFHLIKTSKVPVQSNSQFKIGPHRSDDATNKLWHFIDMRCNKSYTFLSKVEHRLFGHPYRWILFEPDESRLNNLTFLTDSNVIFVNFNTELSRFDLRQGKIQSFHSNANDNVVDLF